MKNKFIIFKTFNNPIEANITKGLLESYGVRSFLQDENTVYANPVLTTAIGGVKLMIMETDFLRASEICDDKKKYYKENNEEQSLCPKCNSRKVIEKNKHNWFALFIMLVSFASTPNSGNVKKYKCSKCHYCWDDFDK